MSSKTFVMVLKKTSWSIPILGSQSSDTINFVTYSLFPSKGEFHVINDFVKRFSDIKRLISNMRELNSGALFFLRDLHPCCSLKQPYFVNFANDWMTKTGGFSYYYFADFRVKKIFIRTSITIIHRDFDAMPTPEWIIGKPLPP